MVATGPIFIYGKCNYPSTREIEAHFIGLVQIPKMTTITSAMGDGAGCYQFHKEHFSHYGIVDINWTDLTDERDSSMKFHHANLLYLAGGNTYQLMQRISDTKSQALITQFHEAGKLIVGCSAGGMVFGNNIGLSNDENTVALRDLAGLGLVDFDMIMHYHSNETIDQKIWDHMERTSHSVIAIPDLGAILIEKGRVLSLGREGVYLFKDGEKVLYNPKTYIPLQ